MKKHRHTVFTKALGISTIRCDDHAHGVTITLAKPFKGKVQVVVHGGVVAANGAKSATEVSMVVS